MKPNIETLPCFDQVAKVIGRERAVEELARVANCIECLFPKNRLTRLDMTKAFNWKLSPQKNKFWCDLYDGINPYTGEKAEP